MARSIPICLAVLVASSVAGAQGGGSEELQPFDPEIIAPDDRPLERVMPPHRAPASDVRLTDRLGYRPWVDGPVTAAIWVGWLGSEAFKSKLGPQECRWCEPPAFDWSVRNTLVWESTGTPRLMSDVMLYGVAPIAAVATTAGLAYSEGRSDEIIWDVLLILEAGGAAAATTQLVKFFVARERPYAYAAGLNNEAFESEVDDNLSFFSGHSSFTFGLAAATATVASMRNRKYAWVGWAVGAPLAAFTAYLRIAGDKHYLSDVVVGGVVGLAVGTLVPAVHDWEAFRGKNLSVAIVPMQGGAAGSFTMTW